MPFHKTSYNPIWESKYNWLDKVPSDIYAARCKICKKNFLISNSGVGQIKQHAISSKHKSFVGSGTGGQLTFKTTANGLELNNSHSGQTKIVLSSAEQICKAETIWALKCCKSNYSFQSNDDVTPIFKMMFDDSSIAKGYQMADAKIKYVIQFGILPYVKEQLIHDMKDTPFSFKFDETTTSQVKKQYDGYVQYYSKKFKKVVNHYAGSLFLGHCTSEDLLTHFFEFGTKIKWNLKYLLSIGMDGPNVNLKFQKLLDDTLMKTYNKKIINVGTCSLHPVHTAFSKGIKKMEFDFDKFAQELHFFFKYSSARRKDYEFSSMENELEAAVMVKHVNSRWLSLKKALLRITEQWINLKTFFIEFLPKQKNFTKEIAGTDRYIFLKKMLTSDMSLIYISFTIYVADIMEKFLIKFQTSDTVIHLLYNGFSTLLYDIMYIFIKKNLLHTERDKFRKEATVLAKIDATDIKNQLSIHELNFGTKTKHLIGTSEGKLNLDKIKMEFKSCLVEIVAHLQTKLPIDSVFLRDVQYIHPAKKMRKAALSAIGRLAYTIGNVLQSSGICGDKTNEQWTDTVKNQFQIFQSESIDLSINDIDNFWNCVENMKDLQDNDRFKELSFMVKACMCVSHANAVPERGFSINKAVLDNRSSLSEDTIEAIRMVKEFVLLHDGVTNVTITKRLLNSVSNSRTMYQKYLETKDEEKNAEKRKSENFDIPSKRQKKDDLGDIDNLISNEQCKLKTSQKLIADANELFAKAISSKIVCKNSVIEARSMLDMGISATTKSQSEINALYLRKEKLLLEKPKKK